MPAPFLRCGKGRRLCLCAFVPSFAFMCLCVPLGGFVPLCVLLRIFVCLYVSLRIFTYLWAASWLRDFVALWPFDFMTLQLCGFATLRLCGFARLVQPAVPGDLSQGWGGAVGCIFFNACKTPETFPGISRSLCRWGQWGRWEGKRRAKGRRITSAAGWTAG